MMATDIQLTVLSKLEILGRKVTQPDEELSAILHAYRTTLTEENDFDEAVRCAKNIDFSVAGQVVDRSLVVYCKKVDKLRDITEQLAQEMASAKHAQKRPGHDDGDGDRNHSDDDEAPPVRRRQRRMRDCVGEDDFYEIDNQLKSQRAPNMTGDDIGIVFLDQKLSHCAHAEGNKKHVDVRINASNDNIKSRLGDWFINDAFMIVREVFTDLADTENQPFFNSEEDLQSMMMTGTMNDYSDHESVHSSPPHEDGDDVYYASDSEASVRFANVKSTSPDYLANYEDFAVKAPLSATFAKYNYIKEIKLAPGDTIRKPCPKCNMKRRHKPGGRSCKSNDELPSLDAYYQPHLTQKTKNSKISATPDSELMTLFENHLKTMKIMEKRLGKDFISESEDQDFAGFDDSDDEDNRGASFDDCGIFDGEVPDGFELPDAHDGRFSSLKDNGPGLAAAINNEGASSMKEFESNKDMLERITKWHEVLRGDITRAEERGVLNMDALAGKIMQSFPQEQPTITFRQLVQQNDGQDIARYFLTVLQLTNEGNISIQSADKESCMTLSRLRDTRLKKLDEYNPDETAAESGLKRKKPTKGSRKKQRQLS